MNEINMNYGIIITYWNCHSIEWLIIAVDGIKHHRTGDWSDVMNGETHSVIGWIIRSPVPVKDEVVIIEIEVLRAGVAACDKP